MAPLTKTVTARLPLDLVAWLDMVAKDHGVTRTQVLISALTTLQRDAGEVEA